LGHNEKMESPVSATGCHRCQLAELALASENKEIGKNSTAEAPLTTRERDTLLVLLAALAKQAGIDLGKPSTDAAQIENAAEQLGAFPATTRWQ